MFNWLIHVGSKCNRKCNIDTVEEYINSEFVSQKSIVNYFKPINFKIWYNQLYFIWLLHILSLQFAVIYNTFYISWMILVINVFLPAHAAIVTFSILFGTSFCKSTHVSFIIHKFITRWVYYFSVSILLFRRYLRIFCGMIEYNVLNNSCFSFELLCSKPTYQTPL